VPFVRANERSMPPDTIINDIKQRTAEGYQEVVLTGTKVGAYNSSGMDLKGLLERILDETTIPRIRLSSVQPQEISQRLIKLWKDKRLCPHFHLSLQSGSASVLARMNRRYRPVDYQKVIKLIRSEVPLVAITTDVIVGFPGETDKELRKVWSSASGLVLPASTSSHTRYALARQQQKWGTQSRTKQKRSVPKKCWR